MQEGYDQAVCVLMPCDGVVTFPGLLLAFDQVIYTHYDPGQDKSWLNSH